MKKSFTRRELVHRAIKVVRAERKLFFAAETWEESQKRVVIACDAVYALFLLDVLSLDEYSLLSDIVGRYLRQ